MEFLNKLVQMALLVAKLTVANCTRLQAIRESEGTNQNSEADCSQLDSIQYFYGVELLLVTSYVRKEDAPTNITLKDQNTN